MHVLRTLRVCSPEFYDNKVNNIIEIALKSKYPKYFIELCLSKPKEIFYKNGNNNKEKLENILVMPYNDRLPKIKHFFYNY